MAEEYQNHNHNQNQNQPRGGLVGWKQKDALGYGLFGARSHRKCLFR